MLHRACASVVLALFVGIDASGAQPQRTFVASYGNDAWPCSLPQPCRGFQAAIDAVASAGEVVALDSAGYGAMEIHKSVSVIVPPGIHAGLSPSTGIPLPGYPGQTGIILIDIQDTDIVVLRGLNINHQGTVTGGIEWISSHGGTVHVENVIVNGFPKEGIYVQAPGGYLFVNDSILRGNETGLFGANVNALDQPIHISTDRLRIEKSTLYGLRVVNEVNATLMHSTLNKNGTAFYIQDIIGAHTNVFIDHCNVVDNLQLLNMQGGTLHYAYFAAAASTLVLGSPVSRTGDTATQSYGNNNTTLVFDSVLPTQ